MQVLLLPTTSKPTLSTPPSSTFTPHNSCTLQSTVKLELLAFSSNSALGVSGLIVCVNLWNSETESDSWKVLQIWDLSAAAVGARFSLFLLLIESVSQGLH